MNETIVLTLTPNPAWGFILQPEVVEIKDEGWLSLREPANSKSQSLESMNEAAVKIVRLFEKYSDKTLMENYSKEKSIATFLKKVKPEVIECDIRPYIEGYQRKMLKLLPESGMKFYFRKSIKVSTLHKMDEIEIPEKTQKAVFHFEKDEEGLKYYIRIGEGEDEDTDLFGKTYYTISMNPAIIVIDKKLLFFEDVDLKKLIPFFTKDHIEIPAASENSYLKTFVLNCLNKYTVRTKGLNIKSVEPTKVARLTLEKDLNNMPVMVLTFIYNNKKVTFDHQGKKIVVVEEMDNKVSISWYHRDKKWEAAQIQLLNENGLSQNGTSHFYLTAIKDNITSEDSASKIKNWIKKNKEVMKNFDFVQIETSKK